METKSQLRQKLKQTRLELTDFERTQNSRAINEKLKLVTDWSKIKTLHYYEPLQRLMEPDVQAFINFLEANYPAIKLFSPRLISGQWQMIAAKDDDFPPQFDAVIVPMLGFDDNLNRIGYGAGYYDKFLATQQNAIKIGVCFEIGKLDIINIESHDITMDAVVSEGAIYKAG
jgi:5-formyltetrahydrofolate cyclo-ligase